MTVPDFHRDPASDGRPIADAARRLLEPEPVWVPPTPTAVELAAGVVSGTMAAVASPLLVPVVARALRGLADDRPPPDPSVDAGDPGWFGPESVAWRIHADPSLLVAGVAAFALQALHPLAMAGVAEHSSFSDDFLGRTRRTAQFVQGVVYGSSAQAERMCRTVSRVHERVVGITPDGRPYAANDPELLHWVHVAEYMAIAAANRRFAVRPMDRAELDSYTAEVARVGTGTGVVDPPRTWADMWAALEHHRPMLAVGEYAAAGISFLDDPPIIPAPALPIWKAIWSGAIASLPPVARRLLRLPDPSRKDLATCRVVLRVLGASGAPPPGLVAARRRLDLPAPG